MDTSLNLVHGAAVHNGDLMRFKNVDGYVPLALRAQKTNSW